MRNLTINYDLMRPGQNYHALHAAIKRLGLWWHPLESMFYVRTAHTAQQVHNYLRTFMDPNDKLVVVEATNLVTSGLTQTQLSSLQWTWVSEAA